jgi:hypothetical protein
MGGVGRSTRMFHRRDAEIAEAEEEGIGHWISA